MSVLFQNPLWLVAALAAIPLLAHLFSRTRPRRRDFPSLRLLSEAMRHVTRMRRPRDRWLLALRTLAMAALAAAFLLPLLLSRFGGGSGANRTLVLVVDATASMAYTDGTRTRLTQATAAAEEILASLPANSRANIVWVRAHAASALPEPGPNLEFLRQALRQATALPEPGDIAGAIALAQQELASAQGTKEGDKELVVISDFQRSAWQNANLDAPLGVRLTRIAVGHDDGANMALTGLAVEPARPVAGQPARLVCRVRNFSAEPRRVVVFAEAGESRLSQTVEAAPWSETLAAMPVKFSTEGLVPLKASLAEDHFPGDDICFGLAEVRGAMQVGVAGPEDDATARIWARAAQALDGVAVRRLTPEQLENPGRLDALFLANWDGRATAALTQHLQRGGALVIQPAANLNPSALRTWLGAPRAASIETLGAEVRDAPGWSLRMANEGHPVFALFATGAYGDPAKANFQRRMATPDFLPARPLLAFDDGRPALTLLPPEAGHRGAIAWWNLDLGAGDWSARTAFLPFFGEFLHQLAAQSGPTDLREFQPGEPLRYEAPSSIDPATVRLTDEHDHPISIAAEAPRTPNRLVSKSPAIPGSYRWMSRDSVLDRVVVNFPDAESDLRRLSEADLKQGPGTLIADSARSHILELREGQPLWPWCLAAAALCLILEGLCIWKFPARAEQTAVPRALKPEEELAAV